MSVLIKGGHIVTAVDDYVGDILIEGETRRRCSVLLLLMNA